MTKNEIIKALYDQISYHKLSIVFARAMKDESVVASYQDYISVLREAAELLKAAPEWISVKDRLPEEYKGADDELINYLCYMLEYGVDIANYQKPAGVWVCMGIQTKVTHWMPLPEKPKKEDTP